MLALRSMPAILTSMLALAACERQAANETVEASAADVAVAPPSLDGPRTASGTMLPKELLGIWAVNCAKTQTRVTIEPTRLRFHDSVATVRSVQRTRPTVAVDVDLVGSDRVGSGRRERHSWDLNLDDTAHTITRVEAPVTDIVYSRCAK